MTSIEHRVTQTIAAVLEIDASEINGDTSVDTVESWYSLRHLNLVLALESEFDISLTEEQTIEVLNYPLIVAVLAEHGISDD